MGILVLCTAHWKQVNDPAQLSYLCFLMDHGTAPYRDLLEINMPGIYLVNWSAMHILGEGSFAWRIFDFSLMGTAAWAMIVIARPYDWLAGVFGATLFALYHGRDGAGQAGQRDFIIAVLFLCAYVFMLAFLFLWVALQIVTGLRARGVVGILSASGLAFALILMPLYVRDAKPKVWDPQSIDSLVADLNHLGGHGLSGHVQCIYMPADCDDSLYRLRLV